MNKGNSLEPKRGGWHNKNPYTHGKTVPKQTNQQAIDFLIVAEKCLGINLPYQLYNGTRKKIFKDFHGNFNWDTKIWEFDIHLASAIAKALRDDTPDVRINQIPPNTSRLLMMQMPTSLEIREGRKGILKTLNYSKLDLELQPKRLPFYQSLYSFQREAVEFGVKHFGRVLIADEMGIGKTVESLALAYMYKDEWPLLVVCPSSLKYTWREQIMRWFKSIKEYEVQIYQKTGVNIREKTKVLIISYDLAQRSIAVLQERGFNVAIADEAHYLKGMDTKRAETVVPMLKCCKRVILLTGTPAFAKPKELFSLLSIVRPDTFFNFVPFGQRYCNPSKSPWSNQIVYDGSKNEAQLHYLLKSSIMIRRLKSQVLTDLPDKLRQKILVDSDSKYTKQINAILSSIGNSAQLQMLEDGDNNESFIKCYSLTAQAKIDSVKEYINEIMENDVKVLIFGHHKFLLDELESFLNGKNIGSIRIDGSVSSELRFERVNEFQTKKNIKAAVLSITAAGVGLTLTEASTVIFAELHWTPATMQQAEDRAHRIGQKSCVNCHYLVAENTLDEILYTKLDKKLSTVGQMIDGQRKKLEAQEVEKGQIGKVSKGNHGTQVTSIEDISRKGNDLLRYFKPISKPTNTQTDISESVDGSRMPAIKDIVGDQQQDQLKKLREDAEVRSSSVKNGVAEYRGSRYKQQSVRTDK